MSKKIKIHIAKVYESANREVFVLWCQSESKAAFYQAIEALKVSIPFGQREYKETVKRWEVYDLSLKGEARAMLEQWVAKLSKQLDEQTIRVEVIHCQLYEDQFRAYERWLEFDRDYEYFLESLHDDEPPADFFDEEDL